MNNPLPEKVLQFGTGRFLRAFADFFIDTANQKEEFNGQIVMVASTNSGRAELLNAQKGCYALWTRGHSGGQTIDQLDTVRAVSRVLAANSQWPHVLELARSPDLEVVISNTTEIGLTLQEDDRLEKPVSFPARLTALLHARAIHFDYSSDAGLVILPCELVHNNGDCLRELVFIQARLWSLGDQFMTWLQEANTFCNTLVDRIVPGLPGDSELVLAYAKLGLRDPLITVAEPYRLWAIEGDESLAERLGFAGDPGVIVTRDIAPYRMRKIRLLNGGHTLTVPVGLLTGCVTVLDNMRHPLVSSFIEHLLREEIGPVLDVDPATVGPYIDEVLERWRNPFMYHRLLDITLHSTSKMRHRVVPTLQDYYGQRGRQQAPRRIALGFAAWLRFMRGIKKEDDVVYGSMHQRSYAICDVQAARFLDWWPRDAVEVDRFVHEVLSSYDLWNADLTELPGFAGAVGASLTTLLEEGPEAALLGT